MLESSACWRVTWNRQLQTRLIGWGAEKGIDIPLAMCMTA